MPVLVTVQNQSKSFLDPIEVSFAGVCETNLHPKLAGVAVTAGVDVLTGVLVGTGVAVERI